MVLAMRFKRMMKLHLGAQFALDDDRRGSHRLIDIALFLHGGLADVGPVENGRGIGLHGVVFLDDEGQWRGFDHDGAQGILALLLRGRGDSGEFLSVKADGALLAFGQDGGLHAGHGLCLGEIDAGDFGGGPFGAKDHAVQPAIGLDVVGVLGGAGDFGRAVDAGGGLAHDLRGIGPRGGGSGIGRTGFGWLGNGVRRRCHTPRGLCFAERSVRWP